MNDPYKDRMDAKKQQIEAKILELKAKMKEASADARIGIQNKIQELEQNIKGFTK